MLVIRPETPEDSATIRNVNEAAFGSSIEADIVEKLRSRQAYALSLVATDGDLVIGHILFSPVTIESGNTSFGALGLGPMAILPSHQRKGVGSQLVRAGLQECRRLGHEIVVVLGHPDYYPRFGFAPASTYGISCEYGVPDEVFMALELGKGAFSGRSGIVKYQPEFNEG
ncbi:MAG TPA: N-acetyltransferase [Dehalococcoidales bacterium]|nr:N-acetyltransferase [Dehalococcoidales bacterium]